MNEYHLKLFKIIFREKYYFREVSARVNNDKQSLLLLPRVLEMINRICDLSLSCTSCYQYSNLEY